MQKPLNQRQEQILLSLKKLDFLNRDQLQKIHRLGSVRNTNRVLSTISPYVTSYRESESSIYYLNNEGREVVNSSKVRRKNQFVPHVLMRNDFYIFMGHPTEWKNEMKVRDNVHSVVCDAWFKSNGRYHFLEVDRTQKMKANAAKIKEYFGLFKNGALSAHLGYFPPIIWLTTSELRKKRIAALCQGLPYTIYTIDDIR